MKTRWGRLVLNSMLLFFALLPASAQPEAGVSGEWRGMLGTLHLSFTLDQAAQAGLSGRMTSLDQGNVTIPIDSVSFAQGALHLELKAIGAVYDAKLSAPGDTLTGTWQQGAVNAPLLLHRPGSKTPALTLKPRTIGQVALTPCTTLDGNTEGLCGTISVWERPVGEDRPNAGPETDGAAFNVRSPGSRRLLPPGRRTGPERSRDVPGDGSRQRHSQAA